MTQPVLRDLFQGVSDVMPQVQNSAQTLLVGVLIDHANFDCRRSADGLIHPLLPIWLLAAGHQLCIGNQPLLENLGHTITYFYVR